MQATLRSVSCFHYVGLLSSAEQAHCHPRFTTGGKTVLYTSDLASYSKMYLVEVGEFEELPELT